MKIHKPEWDRGYPSSQAATIGALVALAAFDAPASQPQWGDDDLATHQCLEESSVHRVRPLPGTIETSGHKGDHAEIVALKERVRNLEKRIEELCAASAENAQRRTRPSPRLANPEQAKDFVVEMSMDG